MERIRNQIRGESKKTIFRVHEVLKLLLKYLEQNGWIIKEKIRMNGGQIDLGAEKDGKVFLIEARGDRGGYTSAEMNFQMGLGQLMSRMKLSYADYGLAFPLTRNFIRVLKKYQGSFAFEKLGIYLIPVEKDGTCKVIRPNEVLRFIRETT